MTPAEDADRHCCPVCGAALPSDRGLRRCAGCGARNLWLPPSPPVELGIVLFNARLCGIMAGIQVGMIALLVAGYRAPIPWGVWLAVAVLPVGGYLLAGEAARRVPGAWRTSLLVGAMALNAGLLVALIAAILGMTDPVALAGITAGAAALLAPLIRSAVVRGDP